MSQRSDAAQHGSRRMRQLGCDCLPCRVAESRYKQAWRRGQHARVPVARVWWHLNRLVRSGWNDREIQAAAGLGNSTLWNIRSGRQQSVNSRTASEIFALTPREPAAGWLVSLAARVARHCGARSATAALSRSIDPAAVTARHQLMRLLRDAGWSCRAVGQVMHRTELMVSRAHLELDDALVGLLDEVPDPPAIDGDQDPDDIIDRVGCEDCGDPPMGGGRWCYPCFLDHRHGDRRRAA